jgi:N-acetylmuramoyl-L-alanine amidase
MKLKLLVIHCTATPEGREVTSKQIRDWHTLPAPHGRGWRQVGYSDMIHLDGQIESLVAYNDDDTVDAWEITNGAHGINSMSRHVVYVGGTDSHMDPKDTRTEEQRYALTHYVFTIIKKHPKIKVAGHNQFAQKACPSFNVPEWLESIGVDKKNIYYETINA